MGNEREGAPETVDVTPAPTECLSSAEGVPPTVDAGLTPTQVTDDQSVAPQEVEPALPPRYQDLGLIAGGGSSEVRRVFDRHLDRVVAMKVLRVRFIGSARMRARFLAEAKITAALQHPGIVAVHDRGEFADGRLWFTMREIRGRTLRAVIEEVHAASSAEGFREAPSGWTFRRLVDAYARLTQAVAYAHSRGVVHRDLKPDNLMVGEFGEVLVMDWGLARRMGVGEGPADDGAERPVDNGAESPTLAALAEMTQHGEILGTPAYMPPEQALGECDLHGPPSDVYALGAILYHLLSGSPPYIDAPTSILRAVIAGPPTDLAKAARSGPPIPQELAAICAKAMQRSIGARYAAATALADDILSFLDGARRREQALALLGRARAREPAITELRAQAAQRLAEARRLLGVLRPSAPIEEKRPGWELEEAAAQLNVTAALGETEWQELVHGALSLDPDLPEAHAMLADHYRQGLTEAEIARRDEDAARFEALLRTHDRGRHAAFLRGAGALSLVTDPPGAIVHLERYVRQDRRLVPEDLGELGVTPLRAVPLQRGSYRLRVRAPGRAEVRYPVLIERDAHWDGCAPGHAEPTPILLPREDELGPEDIYVPAGWCWTGGDPEASDSLPRRRVWIDGFILRRFAVTNREFLEFLNGLTASGREAEAQRACPRSQLSMAEGAERPAYRKDASGRFILAGDEWGPPWEPDWPVVLIDWYGAMAYAGWQSERSGLPWRLPDELEREKAARGADGRICPFGDHLDATLACTLESHPGEPQRGSVYSYPLDESPYGARGLAGTSRDWCANAWSREGPETEGGRLRLSQAPSSTGFWAVRGGAWSSPLHFSRSATRFGNRPEVRRNTTGLRLARSYPG